MTLTRLWLEGLVTLTWQKWHGHFTADYHRIDATKIQQCLLFIYRSCRLLLLWKINTQSGLVSFILNFDSGPGSRFERKTQVVLVSNPALSTHGNLWCLVSVRGGCGHFFILRVRSCCKIFESGVKRNFWPLRKFWPIIFYQLFCFSE